MSEAAFFRLFLLCLLSVADSVDAECDKEACEVGTSTGTAVCTAGLAVGGAALCAVTFGLGCAATIIGAAACGITGATIEKGICSRCSTGEPGIKDVMNKIEGLGDRDWEIKGGFDKMNQWFETISDNDKKVIENLGSLEEGLEVLGGDIKGWFQDLSEKDKRLAEGQAKILLVQEKGFTNLEEGLDNLGVKAKKWYNDLSENDRKLVEGQAKIVFLQKEGFTSLEEGLDNLGIKAKKWYNDLSENDRKLVEGQAKIVFLQKSGFGSLQDTLAHLGGEVNDWFISLTEDNKKLVEGQAKLIFMQKRGLEKLDKIIGATKDLGESVELGQYISLYGDDFQNFDNAQTKFSLLRKGPFGIFETNFRVDVFRDAVLDANDGLESSIFNVFKMMIGGSTLKPESIYEALPKNFCTQKVHEYLLMRVYSALTLYATARAMNGQEVSKELLRQVRQNIIRATQTFFKHCGCPKGYRKLHHSL